MKADDYICWLLQGCGLRDSWKFLPTFSWRIFFLLKMAINVSITTSPSCVLTRNVLQREVEQSNCSKGNNWRKEEKVDFKNNSSWPTLHNHYKAKVDQKLFSWGVNLCCGEHEMLFSRNVGRLLPRGPHQDVMDHMSKGFGNSVLEKWIMWTHLFSGLQPGPIRCCKFTEYI